MKFPFSIFMKPTCFVDCDFGNPQEETNQCEVVNIPADLSIQNGFVEMAWTGEVPWHTLGNESESLMKYMEALEKSGLNWTVFKQPTFAAHPTIDGEFIELPNTFASVREVFGRDENGERDGNDSFAPISRDGYTYTNRYTVIQNIDMFAFVDELVDEHSAIVETCGALHGGRDVWVLARLPGHIRIGGSEKDTIAPYLLLTSRHDGAGALKILPTTVRVVCSNTLGLALSQGVKKAGGICIAHTESWARRAEQVKEALGLINERFIRFGEQADVLASTKITKKQSVEFFADVLGAKQNEDGEYTGMRKRQIEEMVEYLDHKTNRVNGMRGSVWATLNAVTIHTDRDETEAKTADPTKGLKVGDKVISKLESNLTGSLSARKTLALALANARCAEGSYDHSVTMATAKADFLEEVVTIEA